MDKRIKIILIIFFCSLVVGFFLTPDASGVIPGLTYFAEKLHHLELVFYDSHMNGRKPYPPSDKIILATIDEKSEKKLGSYPWKRKHHAKLIENLKDKGAALILFDISFTDAMAPEDDKALAEAAKKSKNVIAAAFLRLRADGTPEVVYPYPELAKNAMAVGIPYVNRDQDQVLRKMQVNPRKFKGLDPLFLAAVKNYLPMKSKLVRYSKNHEYLIIGDLKIPLDSHYNMLINYSGIKYPCLSYVDVMEGNFREEDVRDRIVVVMSMTDPRDQFKTPRDIERPGKKPNRLLFGGEVHANAIQTVLEKRFIRRQSDFQIFLTAFVICLIGALALFKLSYVRAIPVLAAELIIFFLISRYFFISKNLWVNYTIPAAILVLFWTGVFVFESRRMKSIFKQFVPKGAVEKILTSEKELELGGITVQATVLFSDIRGYTSMSEGLKPEEILNFLNEFHELLNNLVEKNKGTTFDYEGDGMLMVFGAPKPLKNHAVWAYRAAEDIQKEIGRLNEDYAARKLPGIKVGIGLCSGEVAYGLIGRQEHKKFTVIGDVVNTASRLQGLSEALDSPIIIGESTKDELGDLFELNDLGMVNVKGKKEKLHVFGVNNQ